jgi:hypothetical protein
MRVLTHAAVRPMSNSPFRSCLVLSCHIDTSAPSPAAVTEHLRKVYYLYKQLKCCLCRNGLRA